MRAGARTSAANGRCGSPSRFSDGNQRWALGLDGRERIHTTPHLKTDLTLELSSQRNSLDAERPYFNPRSDLMVLPGLRLTHTRTAATKTPGNRSARWAPARIRSRATALAG